MPSFNFTSQRPVALTREGGLVEFTEGVDIAVPVAATQVTVAPVGGIAATNAQAALVELDAEKQPLDADLTAVAGLTGTGWLTRTGDATWELTPAFVLNDLADVILSPDTPTGKVLGTTAVGEWGPVDPPASGEPAGAVAAHAAGTGVHTIAGVTGLQTALDGKSATGHLHSGVYEPAGTVATHAALTVVHGISAFGATLVDDVDAAAARTTLGLGTAATTAATAYEPAGAVATHAAAANAHAIAGVTGLQAALDGAVKLAPAGGATQAISGSITLGGAYPALSFNTLTLNLSPTGSLSPANPLGGDAFSTWSALVNYVNDRLIVATLTVVAAPGTYVETEGFTLSLISCGALFIESPGTVVIDGSAVSGLWATFNQTVVIKCPMTISAATRVWAQGAGQLTIQAPVTMTSLALAAAGTLRLGGMGALGVASTLTINQPAGVGACLFAGGIDHYVAGATASLIANKESAHDAITAYAGIIRLSSGGTIDTPGLGKSINIGTIVQYTLPAANLLNGATLFFAHASFVTNGWWRNAATGLIVQWGSNTTNSSGTVSQTLPIAFPNANLAVFATARATTVGVFTTTNLTKTAFTCNSFKVTDGTALSTASFTFLAIGN